MWRQMSNHNQSIYVFCVCDDIPPKYEKWKWRNFGENIIGETSNWNFKTNSGLLGIKIWDETLFLLDFFF